MHIFRVLAENWWPQIAPKVLTHTFPHLIYINVHHQFYFFWVVGGVVKTFIRNGRLAAKYTVTIRCLGSVRKTMKKK